MDEYKQWLDETILKCVKAQNEIFALGGRAKSRDLARYQEADIALKILLTAKEKYLEFAALDESKE